MRRAFVKGVAIASATTLIVTASTLAANPPPTLTTLEPGGKRTIHQALDVNVVLVGYEAGAGAQDVDEADLLAELPSGYTTINRAPAFYGLPADLGVTFDYNYNVVWADTAFEDAFFGYLGSIAEPMPLTIFQEDYNDQANASAVVADNHWIDAPSVEQWLADNSAALVDTSEYTVFLVNWHGRDDFIYHVYTKTDEPDPDTGYNFGMNRETRKIIAWGGTTPDDEENGLGSLNRIWFYDLSAGPESWTDNWNVDDADVDGNGAMDYRMPPVWEYGTDGYRPFDDLSGDLGKVVRYVALDLLFTTSPLYKPAISPPAIPAEIEVDINVYQGEPGVDGRQFVIGSLIADELGELQPFSTYSTEINSTAFSGRAAQVYTCWLVDVSCFGNKLFGIAFADLFLYHRDKILKFVEGDGDYEVPVFAYNTTDDLAAGFLGYADDNWTDGTQSFVFGFDSPFIRELGYGLTTTIIHEVGHHVGMSHPHDGYDAESGVDFGPGDDFYFAWSGDESNTIMSYIDLNWDFSQFDRDNMSRWMTSVYINQANAVLARIYASPKAGNVSAQLLAADATAAAALAAYGSMDYAEAATSAQSAYEQVVAAAAAINIKVEPQSSSAAYKAKGKSTKFVDPVDYHHRFGP